MTPRAVHLHLNFLPPLFHPHSNSFSVNNFNVSAREREREKKMGKNFCHAIYAFFSLSCDSNLAALGSYSVHVSLKMELEIKFSKSRSKFSLNNDNFAGNCFRLVFILHFFFWDKNRC